MLRAIQHFLDPNIRAFQSSLKLEAITSSLEAVASSLATRLGASIASSHHLSGQVGNHQQTVCLGVSGAFSA